MPEVFAGGAWRSLTKAEVFVGGQWRKITRAEGYIGGQWRTIADYRPTITVSVFPPAVRGQRVTALPSYGAVTSEPATATPVGGRPPFTYAWVSLSGLAAPIAAVNATTAFRAGIGPETTDMSTVRVTVTDASGATATATVSVILTNISTA